MQTDATASSPPLSQSPTFTALSRALAATSSLVSSPSLDPGQRLALDVLEGLPPHEGSQLVDEVAVMNEIEVLARGALVLMDYAELLRGSSTTDLSDVYMIYYKTLCVFTDAFRKARHFWDMRGQRVTRRMQESTCGCCCY